MKLKDILNIIPDKLLVFLAKESQVDNKVKKLTGKTMFMVILHSMFDEKNFSLRKLKENFNDSIFQKKN